LTAAVGIAVGLERYLLAVGSTLIVFAVLHLLPQPNVKVEADGPTESIEVAKAKENQGGKDRRSRLGAQDARPE
jgi:uncharacterized membrane protein YhiD involved in acid resistance